MVRPPLDPWAPPTRPGRDDERRAAILLLGLAGTAGLRRCARVLRRTGVARARRRQDLCRAWVAGIGGGTGVAGVGRGRLRRAGMARVAGGVGHPCLQAGERRRQRCAQRQCADAYGQAQTGGGQQTGAIVFHLVSHGFPARARAISDTRTCRLSNWEPLGADLDPVIAGQGSARRFTVVHEAVRVPPQRSWRH